MGGLRATTSYDLKVLLARLVKTQTGIEEIYLFGSRAYQTGSLRSDCDILLRVAHNQNTKASDLRDFAITHCAALDFFLCPQARATSCSNDSFVYAATFDELVTKLDAVRLWSRSNGFADFSFGDTSSWMFRTAANAEFAMTTLPDSVLSEQSWLQKIRAVEATGLPVRPYLGDTLPKAVAVISDVARKMIFQSKDLGQRGSAKSGWTVDLQSEYDCQNLFFTVAKPWLPELGREEIEIHFDDQAKVSDFSLFQGKLVIEMKFIDTDSKKREIVKTLDGLKRFYTRNANIGCLLMIIYVKAGVDVDGPRWETEFTFRTTSPLVTTIVVSIP